MVAKKIPIVIPVFNGWEQTKVCLDALRASEYKNLEIIVVDHGSTDETKIVLPAQYPEVVYVLGDSTLWWTGATNLGIRTAISRGAERIMLMNNDCYVAPDTIATLINHSKKRAKAIIAPVQKDFDTDEYLCTAYRECFLLGFSSLASRTIAEKPANKNALISSKLIAGGRGVIIPIDIFRKVGLFDEVALPHYGADHDFYLRCRKQGIPLYVALDSTVYIDQRRTSAAAQPRELTLKEFYQTLFSRHSHRNLRDLTVLFKKHYPIKHFYYLGVVLNITRYFLVYLWQRTTGRFFIKFFDQ
jgi:GT2 family glycosyltransferase